MLLSQAVLFFIITIHLPLLTRSYEYCSKEVQLCKNQRHIACFNDESIAHIKFIKHIPMTRIARDWILYWLNTYRNEVACGTARRENSSLPPASSMRELAWDFELEYLAKLHTERCTIIKDTCRNTERIPIVGQLLHVITDKPYPLDAAFETINDWFSTAKNVNVKANESVVDSVGETSLISDDFQIMAHDKVTRVGCSIAQCTSLENEDVTMVQYMTCNFDYDFIQDKPVYRKGLSTSGCRDYGLNRCSNFTCLCGKLF